MGELEDQPGEKLGQQVGEQVSPDDPEPGDAQLFRGPEIGGLAELEDLPPDQRGWLLSALCVYAERVWRDPSVTMEEILDHYPQMSGQTRIACGFLGAAVLRDTQRWLSQRQARALRRQQGDRPGRPPAPARERSWSREQDMELTRKLAARLREEAAMAEAGGAEGQD